MKLFKCNWSVLLGVLLSASAGAQAENLTNQLTLSARVGFNISARFKGFSTVAAPSSSRRTPQGDLYNYDDGYVLTDNSGNFGGQTWYWGYDDSSRQVSGNNIVMSRSSISGSSSAKLDDEPSYGAELVFRHLLSTRDKLSLGVEMSANYLNLSLSDSRPLSANVRRTSYAYGFTPFTGPPAATPEAPYQGSPEGPGFVINDTPGEPSTTTVIGGASIQGHRQFDADMWGLRLGAYLETPVGSKLRLSLSGGLAGGWLNGSASWSETTSIGGVPGATLSGSGQADRMLWGFYVAGNAAWQFAPRWSAVAGIQYQALDNFSHAFGGRQVEVDLGKSFFATLGATFNF